MQDSLQERKDMQVIEDKTEIDVSQSERDKFVYVGTMGILDGLNLRHEEVGYKLKAETGMRPKSGDRIEVGVLWRKKDNFRVGGMIEADVIGPDDVITKSVRWLKDE